MRTKTTACAAVLLALTAAACSSGSSSAGSATLPTSAGLTSAGLTSAGTTTAAATGAAATNAAATSAGATSAEATNAAATSAGATSTAGPAASTTAGAVASTAAAQPAAAGTTNACSLLTTAQASSLVGKTFTSAKPSVIASGQDQCDYTADDASMTVIVYQPGSGVTWAIMTDVLKGVSDVKQVSGVGDKAMIGTIELDIQSGNHLIAVQGAGGLASPAEVSAGMSAGEDKAEAVGKALVAALH